MVPKQHTERASRLSTADARPLRADARRNRERIVAAARAVFAEGGFDVPVDVVAARAGVGAGTLYRHFPDKAALFAAVQEERVGELADQAERLGRGEDAHTALFTFLAVLGGEAEVKRDLPDAIGVSAHAAGRMRAALTDLLGRAQQAGTARPELTGDDLVALLKGLFAATRDADPAQADRLRAVLLDGIRPRP